MVEVKLDPGLYESISMHIHNVTDSAVVDTFLTLKEITWLPYLINAIE